MGHALEVVHDHQAPAGAVAGHGLAGLALDIGRCGVGGSLHKGQAVGDLSEVGGALLELRQVRHAPFHIGGGDIRQPSDDL